jgi:hypothetical protein
MVVQKRKANEFVPSIVYNPEYKMRGGGEIGTSISMHGRNYTNKFGRKPLREEATWKTHRHTRRHWQNGP